MIVVMYTQGKMIPMFRMLYANAEYGDMTRTRPEARRVNTWTCAVACSPRLAKSSTSPTGLAPRPAAGNRSSVHQALPRGFRFLTHASSTSLYGPSDSRESRWLRRASHIRRWLGHGGRRPHPRATMPNEPSVVALGEDDFL